MGVERLKSSMMVVCAVVAGVVMTLFTGLIGNTPGMLVGAVYYGYPLAWLEMMVVAPQYFPWVVRPLRLILDIVAWTVVVWIILFVVSKAKKK